MRRYSFGERVTLSGLLVAMACVLAWVAFGLLQTCRQTHQLDQRFEHEGVKTEGVVSGFRYVTHTGKFGRRNSGDYPIVSINTPKGVFQILSSYEYPLNQTMQAKLLGQKVAVVYLRDEPSIGRVTKWHGSSLWVLTSLGVLILLAAMFVFYMAARMLALKTE